MSSILGNRKVPGFLSGLIVLGTLAPSGTAFAQSEMPTPRRSPGSASSGLQGSVSLSLRSGLAYYDDDFESTSQVCSTLGCRIGLAGIVDALLPLPPDAVTLSLQAGATRVDREFEPALAEPEGSVTLGAVGLDLALISSGSLRFNLSAGAAYVSFGDVSDLDDGAAMQAGAAGRVKLAGTTHMVVSTDMIFAGDWIVLGQIGLEVTF